MFHLTDGGAVTEADDARHDPAKSTPTPLGRIAAEEVQGVLMFVSGPIPRCWGRTARCRSFTDIAVGDRDRNT
jgi:hypothetical protein